MAPENRGLIGNSWTRIRSDAYKFYLGDEFGPNTRVDIAGDYSFKIMTTVLIAGGLTAEAKIAYHAYSAEIAMTLTDITTTLTPGVPAMSLTGGITAIIDKTRSYLDWDKIKDSTRKILFGDKPCE